ncbi:MAG: putative low-affinity inorganic phosphate transporter [Frankiales bacterium]|nr:putative low-affinity inorganic phosphate transporter [Frankiales bacterium]
MGNSTLLVLVVITALAFDFTNGFHDTGNAMATSIATGALPPKVAVALSGVLNLVGAFLSLSVAATIASGLVDTGLVTLTVVFAGLAGGILWNLLTWLLGIPSSSSHALIGGIVGSTLAAAGGHAVKWQGLASKVVIPAALSPLIAGGIAALGTLLIYRISRNVPGHDRERGFRIGQIGSASMVSLAHGTNDAQKTMGVITLALIANHSVPADAKAPFWVILSCALAISAGTYLGGWRVIRTLGKGLVEISSPQGMGAESASAATILLSSHFGYSLSTTHVATGSILGTGVAKKGAAVRWSVAGRMATAWLFTLPLAALAGAGAYAAASGIGGSTGVLVVFLVLVALAAMFYLRSRQSAVHAGNVNEDWTGGAAPTSAEPVGAGVGGAA